MSFAEIELSRDKGSPVELYLFLYRSSAPFRYFAYTDAEQPITIFDETIEENITYQPIAIDRDTIKASGRLDKQALEVRTPQSVGLADLFRFFPPSETVNLFIRQGHADDAVSQFLVCWSGRVLNFKVQGAEAIYSCEPIATSLRRAGLRRNYQYGCPHALYGAQCKANKAAASTDVVVLGVNRAVVTLSSSWSSRKSKYVNGMAEWTTADGLVERRSILRCNSDGTVVLDGRAAGLTAGMTVTMILGCDHTVTDCGGIVLSGGTATYDATKNLHDNIQNYGGQPWIPTKNPVGIRNPYY